MQQLKLIKTLKTLQKRERSKFKEYIHSPFLNKNKKIQRLGDFLLQFAPQYEDKKLNKYAAFQYVFGVANFQDLKFNNIVSDLLQLLYDFLAYKEYQEQEQLQKRLQMKALLQREQSEQVHRIGKRLEQIQNKNSLRNYQFYLDNYHLFDQLDQLALTTGTRTYDQNLQLKSDRLDQFYIANKLRIACDMISRNTVVNAGYDCHFLEEIECFYQNNRSNLQNEPAIQIYFQVLQMLRSNSEDSYYKTLIQLLHEHSIVFPPNELRTIYNYALNYCVRQINFGKSKFYLEIFELYKVLLEKKIIYKNGYLTQWAYINIIASGIRLKEFEWTEAFIHQYKAHLQPDEQHNVYTYNLAVLYFEQENYDRALEQLLDVEFTDAFFHMAAKIIQLKCYYMLRETEAFFSLAEASRKYITRNKQLSEYHKKSYSHFTRLASKIYHLTLKSEIALPPSIEKERSKLQAQLQQLEPIANKTWLRDALERIPTY